MWTISFNDYIASKQSFDRLFKNTAASPDQAKLFEAVAEALMDAALEYASINAHAEKERVLIGKADEILARSPDDKAAQEQRSSAEKRRDARLAELRKFPYTPVKAQHRTIPRNKLKWLKLSVEDYVLLTRNKVIGD